MTARFARFLTARGLPRSSAAAVRDDESSSSVPLASDPQRSPARSVGIAGEPVLSGSADSAIWQASRRLPFAPPKKKSNRRRSKSDRLAAAAPTSQGRSRNIATGRSSRAGTRCDYRGSWSRRHSGRRRPNLLDRSEPLLALLSFGAHLGEVVEARGGWRSDQMSMTVSMRSARPCLRFA